jgi:Protein of unknown function (DUF2970)
MTKQHDNEAPSLSQLIGSVFSALLGVQSDKNRQRDFHAGDAKHYIIIGIIATLLLVAGLVTIVSLVLS